jgi:hypothetical protein
MKAQSPAPAARTSAQDLLLQKMQAQLAQQAATKANLKENMETMQKSRAGSPASAVQVEASQDDIDHPQDAKALVPASLVISRFVKDKLQVIRPCVFRRRLLLLEAIWQHMEEIEIIFILFSRSQDFNPFSCGLSRSRPWTAEIFLGFSLFVSPGRPLRALVPWRQKSPGGSQEKRGELLHERQQAAACALRWRYD